MSSDNPFWFASRELLTDFLRDEIHVVTQLFAKYPNLSEFFDLPEATVPQRAACFELLAHRALMDTIYERFAGLWEQSPSLGDEEENVLKRTQNLFAADAPAWVLELNEVAELLPSRVYDALPAPLQRGGFNHDNAEEIKVIHSAMETLEKVEQIQGLIARVLDLQLRRLEGRWSAATRQIRESKKRKNSHRVRDKQRVTRDRTIAEIDAVAQTTSEFLKLMDERGVKPQPTWPGWPGLWVQAYRDPRLRELIHKDKSRALSRARAGRKG